MTSMARLGEVHPELKRRILQLDALIPSLSIQVTQGLRTWGQQDQLWQQGRTAPGPIVTDAPAGFSAHNFGYAVDLVPEDIMPGQPNWDVLSPAWKRMLAVGRTCGLAEGATWRTFPDNPHFYLQELPADPTELMREQFTDGGLVNVWANFPEVIRAATTTQDGADS